MTTLLLGRGQHPRVQGGSGTPLGPLATPGLGSRNGRSVGQHLLVSGVLWWFSICLGCRASALMVRSFPPAQARE